tara:strand:+ start:17207 stop:18358 length:1152 start_codon:yes stop_codon:yes gene_type:complete
MNVLEMHIALKQGVDKMHSERSDQLRTEEIDIELNKAMMRFINQRYGKNNIYKRGFEESQKRIDELRSLIVEYSDTVNFKEEVTNGKIWADSFEFPSDYMYLVNQRSTIHLNNCKPLEPNSVTQETLPSIYYFVFSLEQFFVQNNEFLNEIRLVNPDTNQSELVWSPSPELIASGYTPNSYPQNVNAVVNDMFEHVQPGFSIHWQSYGPLTFPSQFIVVVDTEAHPWFQWDGSNGETITPLYAYDSTQVIINESIPRVDDRSGQVRRIPTVDTTKTQVFNKFSQLDDVYRLLEDPFNTTTESSPLTTIRDNYIDIYTSAIFIIDSVKITYIRKPLSISLPLGYNCELPEHTHQEIVAMAVSSILEQLSDPRYKTQMGELMNRE